MEVQVRLAVPDDLGAIHRIRLRAILAIEPGAFSVAELRTWAAQRQPEYFAPALVHGRIIIAVRQDQLLAWVSSDQDKVGGLYVEPKAGGQGLGTFLMRQVEKKIAARGHSKAVLAASLSAVGFYSRLGYRKTREKSAGGAFHMEKLLVPPPATAETIRPASK
jgi:GNAT superfamily N-acetyltransferase